MVWYFIFCIVCFYAVTIVGIYLWTRFTIVLEDVNFEQIEESNDSIIVQLDVWQDKALNAEYEMAWEIEDNE